MRAMIVDGGAGDPALMGRPEATASASPQPNVLAGGPLGRRFWLLVPITGLAAGLGAGLLMRLLAIAQGLPFGERGDTFLEAVQATGWGHRVLVLAICGVLVACPTSAPLGKIEGLHERRMAGPS